MPIHKTVSKTLFWIHTTNPKRPITTIEWPMSLLDIRQAVVCMENVVFVCVRLRLCKMSRAGLLSQKILDLRRHALVALQWATC